MYTICWTKDTDSGEVNKWQRLSKEDAKELVTELLKYYEPDNVLVIPSDSELDAVDFLLD